MTLNASQGPTDWLDGEGFYEVMHAYRTAPVQNQAAVAAAYDAVKEFIRRQGSPQGGAYQPAGPSRVLSTREAAAFLGICQHTLWKMAQSGEIPGRQVGTRWRFLEDDLRRYMRGGK